MLSPGSHRPHQALTEAIPIAKARDIIQLTMSGPEWISGIAIISKIPVTFSRVTFAPAILATIHERADYYRQEITRLRLIARAGGGDRSRARKPARTGGGRAAAVSGRE